MTTALRADARLADQRLAELELALARLARRAGAVLDAARDAGR